ncbi:PLP-dependent aminotransferase family protein [Kineosporia sp. J2-2]|uniref:PLP-dependent aminotransferase family protein n=1 Tax=Kineosporia corallincola TaxID=2835133 RepID=A0ABS5THD6_9ACTN|nr:PLP-dependent aminotransferase family protein [Kineosporia corallincola]MBT0770509.1 PLP-dependent aminotransferase family protein [Kineosporia corallincola]
MPLLTDWRSTEGVPGYRALADRLRLLVLDGRLPVDTVLPSERTLAEALQTSRTTTTSAYRLLRESGFAEGSQGAGTWTTLPRDSKLESPIWPEHLSGEADPSGARGDFSSAALEAPAELYPAYQAALAELPRFLPGNGYVTSGLPILREGIARYYTDSGLPTTPEQILVTNGALQALHLALGVVLERGDRVLVEHPTYPAAAQAIRELGGRCVPLPVEAGWDISRTANLIRQTGAHLAYLMADFHNPTGRLLGEAGRRELGAMIADTGCRIIVDETMREVDLRAALPAVRAGRPVPGRLPMPRPVAAFAPAEHVITLGSASKTFWGGLRIGWIRASQPLIRRLALARGNQDLGGPLLEQLATVHLLENLGPITTQRQQLLAERCVALHDALAERFPDWVLPLPEGGLSLWCHLPEPRSSHMAAAARSLGVWVTPGPRFGLDGAFEARIRLPFARPVPDLVAMADVLARAWHSRGRAAPFDDDRTTV